MEKNADFSYPNKLYKYLAPGDYLKDTLRDGTLLLRYPNTFNDPFDCSPRANKPTKEEKIQYIEDLIRRLEPNLNRANYRRRIGEFNLALTPEKILAIIEDNIEKVRGYTTILCLTSNPMEILMWAHYAKEHCGICVEITFGDIKEIQYPIFPVKYVTERPGLGILDFNGSGAGLFNNIYCKKYDKWDYEDEWRFIQNPNYLDDILNTPPLKLIGRVKDGLLVSGFKISKIYLGKNISKDLFLEIKEISKERNIDLVRVDLCKDKYQLIEYPAN